MIAGLLLELSSLHAQTYSIDWYKIAGGGGTSTGGTYAVSGTIGQPEAGGPLTNGQYSVIGGFWVLPPAAQVSGAPTLMIDPATPGQATVSWTPATAGLRLTGESQPRPGQLGELAQRGHQPHRRAGQRPGKILPSV